MLEKRVQETDREGGDPRASSLENSLEVLRSRISGILRQSQLVAMSHVF